MPQPEVSVLMSVYNGERHLSEALESLLGQTFSNFEFMIVDDASTDKTSDILKEYARRDTRIRLMRNTQNVGLTRSLNLGLRSLQGEYVARLDADDVCLPNRLKTQRDYLDEHPQVGAVGSGVQTIDEQGTPLEEARVPVEHEALQAQLLVDNCFLHSTVMARRSVVQQVGGYDERLRYAQDYDLWWRISRVAHLAALPEILVRLRLTSKSISKLHLEEQKECALEVSLRAVQEDLDGQLLHKEAYQRFWWAYHGQYDLLQRGDIRRLQSFWNLLASHASWRNVWRLRLFILACRLVKHGHGTEGLRLFWVLTRRFGQPRESCSALKSLARRLLIKLAR